MRVAVTGATGRLGRALIAAIPGALAWSRPGFDLDRPTGIHGLLDRDRPDVVVHAAAWTDVDGCARDPDVAMRRNGEAVHVVAEAAAARGVDLVLVSTNEVFDGSRTDGAGYRPEDRTAPGNPYGASKLAGETAATAAYRRAGSAAHHDGRARLTIVRTAWLYGPPGNDFPSKIVAAALQARDGNTPLKVVGDEFGSPTFTADLAGAIAELVAGAGPSTASWPPIVHWVNAGAVSRAAWAAEVLRLAGVDVAIEEVPASTWVRASTPPPWAVLLPSPRPTGAPLRPWQEALRDYGEQIREAASRASNGAAQSTPTARPS